MSPIDSLISPMSVDEWVWYSEPGRSTVPRQFPLKKVRGSAMGCAGIRCKYRCCRSPAEWVTSDPSWPAPATTLVVTTALEKRQREVEESHGDGGLVEIDAQEMPPQKRARDSVTNGILRQRSPTLGRRIPKQGFNGKPKEAGRGAERLTTPSVQGIYHQSSRDGWRKLQTDTLLRGVW